MPPVKSVQNVLDQIDAELKVCSYMETVADNTVSPQGLFISISGSRSRSKTVSTFKPPWMKSSSF